MKTDQYLAGYRRTANRRYLGILLAQLPVAVIVAAYHGVELPPVVAMGIAIAAMPLLACLESPRYADDGDRTSRGHYVYQRSLHPRRQRRD